MFAVSSSLKFAYDLILFDNLFLSKGHLGMFKVNEKNASFLTWSYVVLGYNGRLIPDKLSVT